MCKGILCLSADSLHCGPNYHDEQNLVHYEHDLETYGEIRLDWICSYNKTGFTP